ncbi:oligopeptide ABC transporter substrate-binding protein [Lactobacillus sanfranciscensis]|uniref:Oligopeptide-binding protein oppA n=1 Tax=Fructilactobacillus sanfranciscensis (strain TMW 1.1304) TaxID=714313 RepID=G2KTS8_FRUST|nr:oligopeptide ABC transporter substrate-binding protein [Fructilactobacillus sanfranciscensis]AEN98521.1 Oligopeptide-binding protein oppA [Fructilactobacillus sanfranciscensis TMW 1.1304]NDR76058.1 oligopeptide ABC transporter substrate-binding protein [Fructilactobacillus sanfranciscensis]NDR96743.1 oligopeptide ABC transporter substrate-binding protein [Fructilactobacillus sanfranciscensis]NDS04566.1 oligopeptide ABC transporter substrate-binding protein [Fructilactobacillus sanfranciscens
MKKRHRLAMLGSAALLTLTLAACSNGSNNSSVKTPKLPQTYSASAKASPKANDGTLKIGEVSDSPFTGISSPTLASVATDTDVFAPGGQGNLFATDNNYKIVNGGMANLKLDKKANTATITLRKNAKWSNGTPVTAKDIEYAYELIANPDTKSSQYSEGFENIKGMKDYHEGKSDTISGITYPDGEKGKTAVIHFDHLTPAMQYAGNSFIWGSVEPYEYLKDVKIADLVSSDKIRKDPIFTGAYKLDKVVEGESTSWSPNKYYWGKKAKIKHVDIQVVSTNNVTAALKAKKYDFLQGGASAADRPKISKLKDYQIVGNPAFSYSYFGFNLGHMDPKTGKQVTDKNKKMSNKSLRKAMMYAIDRDQVAKKFGNGVSWRANTLLPPVFKDLYNAKTPGFKYNMKKANKLLDDAGYKKKGKWRAQPNGKPLVINFAVASSTATANATHKYELQQWRKLGLNVKYTSGKPMEFNSYTSAIQKPDQKNIDVWNGAWSLSSEPTPTQIYGQNAPYNMGHFVSKENTKLLNNMNNSKAWNDKYRAKQFKDWQAYMNKEAAYAPDAFSLSWVPVNKRVKGYSVKPADGDNSFSNLQLTQENPK